MPPAATAPRPGGHIAWPSGARWTNGGAGPACCFRAPTAGRRTQAWAGGAIRGPALLFMVHCGCYPRGEAIGHIVQWLGRRTVAATTQARLLVWSYLPNTRPHLKTHTHTHTHTDTHTPSHTHTQQNGGSIAKFRFPGTRRGIPAHAQSPLGGAFGAVVWHIYPLVAAA